MLSPDFLENMMAEAKTAARPQKVAFVAVRKVCTEDGTVVRPGEKGEAEKATVQKLLDIGAVKIALD